VSLGPPAWISVFTQARRRSPIPAWLPSDTIASSGQTTPNAESRA
jgi:hypothetical protein